MRDLPADERPRERLVNRGAAACSSAELLAIIMRTGSARKHATAVAEELIQHFGGLKGAVSASVQELTKIHGIGEVKAIQIAAMVELSKRLQVVAEGTKPLITGPRDAYNLMMPEMRDLRKEHLVALMLDTRNRVVKIVPVTIGLLGSSLVHPREVFREAIVANAASLIVVHNHPSGDPAPSEEDKRITSRLAAAGAEIGIELLDHVIIGHNRFASLKEMGLM